MGRNFPEGFERVLNHFSISPYLWVMKSLRNKIALVLIIISLVLLIPGLTRPVLTISVKNQLATLLQSEMVQQFLNQLPANLPVKDILAALTKNAEFSMTRTIMESIRDLVNHQYFLTAGLIFLFSVLLPFIKSALLGSILVFPRMRRAKKIRKFVNFISKWAMAEVFVVAIFIAYFAIASSGVIDAVIEEGFYWFLGYCVLSIAAAQLIKIEEIPAEKGL